MSACILGGFWRKFGQNLLGAAATTAVSAAASKLVENYLDGKAKKTDPQTCPCCEKSLSDEEFGKLVREGKITVEDGCEQAKKGKRKRGAK